MKRSFVDQIQATDDRGERARLYSDMHAMLDRFRDEARGTLDALDEAADTAAQQALDASVAGDRTWPWPLYSDEQLMALRDEVRSSFGLAAGAS